MPTSIATKKGDGGQTSLTGGVRVSKSSIRVEAYGTVDEAISAMGFARSICEDADLRERTKAIQRELFKVGSALATPPENRKGEPPLNAAMIDALTDQVHQLEAIEGMLSDWSIPGEHAAAAAYDVAQNRVPPRRALRGAIDRRRRSRRPACAAVPQSTLRFVVAVRPQAGTGCRGQRIAARRQ